MFRTLGKFIFRDDDRPQKFSVLLDTDSVTRLETANQHRLDAHKLPLQSELTFEMLKHKGQANQMVEMGFTDFSTNIYALIKSSGCINGAIGKFILENGKKERVRPEFQTLNKAN